MSNSFTHITSLLNSHTHSSRTWSTISQDERNKLQGDGAKEDGEFWMSFEDMCKHYTDFEMCSVSIDQMYEDDNGEFTQ